MVHTKMVWSSAAALVALCASGCHKSDVDHAAAQSVPSSTPAASDRSTLADSDVESNVKAEFRRDKKIDESRIYVAVKDGIVALTGSVDNLISSSRAAKIAEIVRGVRSVSNRVVIEPLPRPDGDIDRDVQEALRDDSATEKMPIHVAVKDGVVTLQGTVQSWQEQQLAKRIADGVRGVKQVQDDLQIRFGVKRADDAIVGDIRSRLSWDSLVENDPVGVYAKDGKVTLSGTIGSAAEESRAIVDAWVDGVVSVDPSQLEVRWWDRPDKNVRSQSSRSDQDIAKAIRDAILFDPRVKPFEITPRVTNGVATLTGTVGTIKAKMAAESLARNTVGVNLVKNQLELIPQSALSDRAIGDRINKVLAFDPITDGRQVHVTVKDGDVALTGSVDTDFESAEAFDVASGISGVKEVKDDLLVSQAVVPYVYSSYLDPYEPYAAGWYMIASRTPTSDAELEHRIDTEIRRSPFVPPDEVHVQVKDGKATLTGTVATSRERATAGNDAFQAGATGVDNELKLD
ncbi:MAG TPA: BON domain-containing protein [Polyangiaceae bacterium]|jgi:osmotically-inducible protein OsmY|nr:BON domain-containing protein [Polyangiaceae bacterium]